MKLTRLGRNTATLTRAGVTVLFSYADPVAAHVEGVGYIRDECPPSRPSAGHISAWLKGRRAARVPRHVIAECASGERDADGLRFYLSLGGVV